MNKTETISADSQQLTNRINRIRHQIFSIPIISSDIRKKILLLPKNQNQITVKFRHFVKDLVIDKCEELLIKFPQQYPLLPPLVSSITNTPESSIDSIFLKSELVDQRNWKPQTTLANILLDIYQFADSYRQSQYAFMKNKYQLVTSEPVDRLQNQETVMKTQKIKYANQQSFSDNLFLKDCTESQHCQTHNLNRYFYCKLRQIYRQIQTNLPQSELHRIQDTLNRKTIGFQQIRMILSNKQYNQQVKKQLNNGMMMHKIMKGVMSISSKKSMIKYYHVMLLAAEQPDTFTSWEYRHSQQIAQNMLMSEQDEQNSSQNLGQGINNISSQSEQID